MSGMYKCLECGHIFEEGEQARWIEPHGEPMQGCPVPGCGGAYEEAHGCRACGRAKLEDELYEGICAKCLKEAVTYETALDYLSESGIGLLAEFLFCYACESPVFYEKADPSGISARLKTALCEMFFSFAREDQALGRGDFLSLCRFFILDSCGDEGMEDFAQWLAARCGA